MAPETIQVTSSLQDGLQTEAKTADHKVIADEPQEMGGDNTGMSPAELVLAGLGSCVSITTASLADSCNVELNGLQVDTEGKIDLEGFKGNEDVVPGFQNVNFTIHIDSTSPEENVEELINLVHERCPIADTLARSVEVTSYYEQQ